MKAITINLGTVIFTCRPEDAEKAVGSVCSLINNGISCDMGRYHPSKELTDLRDGKVVFDNITRVPAGTVTLFSEDFAYEVHTSLCDADLHRTNNDDFVLSLSDDFLEASNHAYDEIESIRRSLRPKTNSPMIRQH